MDSTHPGGYEVNPVLNSPPKFTTPVIEGLEYAISESAPKMHIRLRKFMLNIPVVEIANRNSQHRYWFWRLFVSFVQIYVNNLAKL